MVEQLDSKESLEMDGSRPRAVRVRKEKTDHLTKEELQQKTNDVLCSGRLGLGGWMSSLGEST